jgi:hypothetical protein
VLLSTIVGQPTASDLFERRQELVAARRAAGLGGPSAADLARVVGSAAVSHVEFDSNVTPLWAYDPSAPARPGGDWLMRLLQPSATIVPAVGPPLSYAPYGRPSSAKKQVVALVVGLGTVVGVATLAGLVAKAFSKPRQANPHRGRRRRRR